MFQNSKIFHWMKTEAPSGEEQQVLICDNKKAAGATTPTQISNKKG